MSDIIKFQVSFTELRKLLVLPESVLIAAARDTGNNSLELVLAVDSAEDVFSGEKVLEIEEYAKGKWKDVKSSVRGMD